MTKFYKAKLVVNADGTVTGIDEQLTTIKETYKDLFRPPVRVYEPYKQREKSEWSKKSLE